MDANRYRGIVAEQEGTEQCTECQGMLQKVEVPTQGFGTYATSYVALYCGICDLYYYGFNEELLSD